MFGLAIGILIILLVLTYRTSTDIIEGVENEHRHYFSPSLMIRTLIGISVFCFFEIFFFKNRTSYVQELTYGIFIIHIFMTALSGTTDPITHRINRYVSRFAYIMNSVLLIALARNMNFPLVFYIYFGVYIISVLLGFLFVSGIGTADYRIMLLVLPTLAFMFKEFSLISVLFSFVTVIFVQMFLQLKRGKIGIPIGDKFMYISCINILIGIVIGVI